MSSVARFTYFGHRIKSLEYLSKFSGTFPNFCVICTYFLNFSNFYRFFIFINFRAFLYIFCIFYQLKSEKKFFLIEKHPKNSYSKEWFKSFRILRGHTDSESSTLLLYSTGHPTLSFSCH